MDAKAQSAGTFGSGTLNPVCVQAIEELGISMDGQYPKALTQDMAESANVIISMGCGVNADACPAKFLVTEDWGLDDPNRLGIEEVRLIRDDIRIQIETLLRKIGAE